jgi:hypothetical protein
MQHFFLLPQHTGIFKGLKMGMQRKLWSLSSLAVELQKNVRTIAKALDGVQPDGVLGPKQSPAWFLSSVFVALTKHEQQSGRGRTGIGDQRVRLVKEQADKVAHENATRRSEYWLAADVVREWADVFRELSAKLLAIPDRLASRLPHLSRFDLHEIDAEIRIVLKETFEAYDPEKGFSVSDTPAANPIEENDSEKE